MGVAVSGRLRPYRFYAPGVPAPPGIGTTGKFEVTAPTLILYPTRKIKARSFRNAPPRSESRRVIAVTPLHFGMS
jgi:hypothetical protein